MSEERAGQGGVRVRRKAQGPRKKREKIQRPRAPGSPFTVEQVAAELNLAPRTVRKRIAEGKLRAYHDGRAVRVTEGHLAEYKAALMPGVAPGPTEPLPLRRHLRPKVTRV